MIIQRSTVLLLLWAIAMPALAADDNPQPALIAKLKRARVPVKVIDGKLVPVMFRLPCVRVRVPFITGSGLTVLLIVTPAALLIITLVGSGAVNSR